jgi:DNA-directed RNA polymerase subunit M/transcription elongation factor TFIIS
MNLSNISTRDPELARFLEDSANLDESFDQLDYGWLVLDRLVHSPGDSGALIQKCDFTQYQKKEEKYILDHTDLKQDFHPLVLRPEEIFQQALAVGIRCVNCKEKNVHYTTRARRRGDEPMVAECICRTCQHKFTLAG